MFLYTSPNKEEEELKTPLAKNKRKYNLPPKIESKSCLSDSESENTQNSESKLFHPKKSISKYYGKYRPIYKIETKTTSSHSEMDEDCFKTPTLKKKSSTFQNNTIKMEKNLKRPSFSDYLTNISDVIKGEEETQKFLRDFDIIETVGTGCFGKVYKCRGLDKQIYAVKFINNQGKGPIKTKRILNEIHNLAFLSEKIESENIVRYYSSWKENDGFYIVMEYCPMSLSQKSQTIIKEEEIICFLKEILKGLMSIHENSIVHLDIKPDNILISSNNSYKIADFGLSRSLNKAFLDDITEGDSRYMAMELLNDIYIDDRADLTKADIFSLGITIYEIMTKENLVGNGEIWHKLRSNDLFLLEKTNYSEKLKGIVKWMMQEKPKDRPSAKEILENFE